MYICMSLFSFSEISNSKVKPKLIHHTFFKNNNILAKIVIKQCGHNTYQVTTIHKGEGETKLFFFQKEFDTQGR